MMRERILVTAAEILEVHGVKFTMSELASQLGVSKRCIYEHFHSKEELVDAILSRVFYNLKEIRASILNDPTLSLEEKVKRLLTTRQTVFPVELDQGPIKIRQFFPNQWMKMQNFFDEWLNTFDVLIQQGIDSGQFRPIYLPLFRKIIKGSYEELIQHSFFREEKVTLSEMMDLMADILLYGMVQPKEQSQKGMKDGEN